MKYLGKHDGKHESKKSKSHFHTLPAQGTDGRTLFKRDEHIKIAPKHPGKGRS